MQYTPFQVLYCLQQKKDVSATSGEDGKVDSQDATGKKKKRRREQDVVDGINDATPATSLYPTAETTPVPVGPSSSDVSAFLTENRIIIHTPAGEHPIPPILAFDQLAVQLQLRDALLNQGFKKPTPIQSCSWPILLKGRDMVGIAETGSGKTLAFGVPALPKLLGEDPSLSKGIVDVTTLIVAPTRELAMQTYDTLEAIGRPWGIGCICLYGGVDKDPQRKALNGKDGKLGKLRIVVGTPGRILDLLEEGCLDLKG